MMLKKTKVISLSSRLFNFAHRKGFCKSIEPIIIVNEFPKSGGTWLSKMMATALDLPFIDSSVLPPGAPCVIRNHWDPFKLSRPCVFIVRDYRDVMVSLFHHRCRNYEKTPQLNKIYKKNIGEHLNALKIRDQMAAFLESELSSKRYGNYLGWVEHMNRTLEVCQLNPDSMIVKYEDLVSDTHTVLSDILRRRMGAEIPSDKIDLVVKLYDIQLMKKMDSYSGQTTFVRQGAVGKWSDSFDDKSLELTEEYAGEMIRKLEYS